MFKKWILRISSRAKHDEGFTLVELMISIAILALVTTALVALVNMNTTTAARAENKSRINDAMAQLADELRAMPFDQVGKVVTYTADGGHIVLNLSVRSYKEDNANVKIAKIEGRSRRLDPNNVEEMSVILRSSNRELEDPDTAPEVALNDFIIYENITFSAAQDGDTVWGPLTFDTRINTFAAEFKPLQSVRMYVNGEQIYESLNPEWWVIHRVIINDTASRFPDGILHVRTEVIDGYGSYMDKNRYLTLDNAEPAKTLPDVEPTITTVNGISASWETLPDPQGGKAAMRYKAVLIAKDSSGKVLSSEDVIVGNPSPDVAAETKAEFTTPYSSANNYQLYVYVMCPPKCKHAAFGSSVLSSSYLYREF